MCRAVKEWSFVCKSTYQNKHNILKHNPHGNHKESLFRIYTKRNEKEIKACNSKKKSMKHKGGRGGLRYKKSYKSCRKQNSKSFPISNYIKCNKWIKSPNQKTQIGWMDKIKKRIQLYAVYKKLTLDLRTHIGWVWKDRKRHSMQMVTTRAEVALWTSEKRANSPGR